MVSLQGNSLAILFVLSDCTSFLSYYSFVGICIKTKMSRLILLFLIRHANLYNSKYLALEDHIKLSYFLIIGDRAM